MIKSRKFFVFFLSCLMVLMMIPVTAFAGDAATPKNGTTTTKNTTQAELDAWAGEGALTIETVDGATVVTLQKDIKMGKTGGNPNKSVTPINFGKHPDSANDKMILDLNGHNISSDTMTIVSVCDLTIKDSIGIGSVYMDTSDSKAQAFGAVVNQRKLTIEGGTFEAKIHPDNKTVGVVSSAVADVETVIDGGKFIGSGSAVYVSSGTITIKGGEFEGTNYGIIANGKAGVVIPEDSKAVVTSGSFPIVVGKSGDNTGSFKISGGTFNGTDTTSLVGGIGKPNAVAAVNIEGGTFTQDPGAYTGDNPVAKIGGEFVSGENFIKSAVKNVENGDTVEVTKGDIDLTEVPDGVTVKNSGEGSVSVNGDAVKPSESQTAHTHVWGNPVFTWSDDYKTCTAKRTCVKDAEHVETASAVITSSIKTPATCTQKGVTAYTAKAVFDGTEYTDEKNAADIPVIAHTCEKIKGKAATCTEDGWKSYYHCDICDKYFEDAEGFKEITDLAAWKKDAGKVDKTGHIYKDGICSVCGQKEIGYVSEEPKTGDDSNVVLWVVLMLAAGLGIGGVAYSKRRKDEK